MNCELWIVCVHSVDFSPGLAPIFFISMFFILNQGFRCMFFITYTWNARLLSVNICYRVMLRYIGGTCTYLRYHYNCKVNFFCDVFPTSLA